MRLGGLAAGPQDPFRITGCRQRATLRLFVAQFQTGEFEALAGRHGDSQFAVNPLMAMCKPRISASMGDYVILAVADRQGGRRPDIAGLIVAEVNDFTRRVADGVVRPGREFVLATVSRPRISSAGLGDEKSEVL